MKGDFSRFTFNSKNHYSRVLMQQGRVQLDADWNEQLDISAYRTETEITDFIGQSGAPENPKSLDQKPAYEGDVNYQSTSFRITPDGIGISIGRGRYYVEGMLFENNDLASFTDQPDYPPASPTETGVVYLAYLDVWQHHITALEVPTLREVALGGADTTTRIKNVWQVKLHKLGAKGSVSEQGSDYAPEKWRPDWDDISTGQLTVQAQQPEAILENQLYRVEIHQGNAVEGDQNPVGENQNPKVTFKWSRDNGAIAAQIESSEGNDINIKNTGRDTQLAFPKGQLIEVSNETLTLCNQPGFLAIVQTVQGDRLNVKWQTPNEITSKNLQNWIVRRWDSSDAVEIGTSNPKHQLGQGITVQFESDKRYRTGDYWLIPTRALTKSIEWSPESQRPHGIQHRYCSLALLEWTGNQYSVLADCRSIFKPITSGLLSKAGDTMRGDLTIEKNLYVIGKAAIGYAGNGDIGAGLGTSAAKLDVNGALQVGGAGSIDAVMEFPSRSFIILPPQSIPTGNQITVCFWLNGDVRSPGNACVISAIESNGNRVLGIFLPFEDKVIFDCGNVNNNFDRLEFTISPSDWKGIWSHWAFTKDSTTGNMEIYKDGKLLTSGNDRTNPLPTTTFAVIGKYSILFDNPYDGLLANIRIWKRALSSIEIQAEMSNILSNTTGLVASYSDIKANVVKDYSGNNFNGTSQAGVTSKIFKFQNQVMFGAGSERALRHLIKSRHDGKIDAGNALDFYIWNTTKTPQELGTQHTLTLNGEGRVGIGTTEPKAKLHINGDFIIEQGQLVRGFPVISFLSSSANIPVSVGTGSNAQIEFNFPSEVVQAEVLLKSWDLQSTNIDANQSINQISIQANVLTIEQKKVTVEVNYSWSVDQPKAVNSQFPENTGLNVTVVVIAAMNKTI